MVEPLAGMDWLSDAFTTTNQRLVVSIAAVGGLFVVLLASRSLQRWLNDRTRPLYADVVAAVLLVGTCLATVSVTVGVWGLTEDIAELWAEFGLGYDVVARAIVTGLLLLTAYIVSRFVRRVIRDVLDPAPTVTDHQQEVTRRVAQVLLWSVAVVIVLGIWVDDLGGLLVGAGVLGIVLGMAARQTLGSMLSGFVLMFSRPFEIGDWVVVDEHEGIVTDISIVNTRIRTVDGEYVIVPNDVVGSSALTNRSRNGRLRVEVEVGVDYDADVEHAAAIAEEAVADLDEALSMPAPRVVTKSFGDSAILLGVRFWIDEPTARRYSGAHTEAAASIKAAFEAEGIKIPFPQRELSGRAEAGGFRVAREELSFDDHEAADARTDADPVRNPRSEGDAVTAESTSEPTSTDGAIRGDDAPPEDE